MRITVAAIGRLKSGPEKALTDEYTRRLPWKVSYRETDASAGASTAARKEEEAKHLLAACKGAEKIIALDETGKTLSSPELAALIGRWQTQGCHHLACIIGGPDGLSDTVRTKADCVLSFGRLTWPHLLVRAMLAEQLYRAHSIQARHPYHRA